MPRNAGLFVPECRRMPRGVRNAAECREGSRMPKALPAPGRRPNLPAGAAVGLRPIGAEIWLTSIESREMNENDSTNQ